MITHSAMNVDVMHEARVAELANDYAIAREDTKRMNAAVAKVANFVRQQVQNLASGLNSGNSGTLAPSV